MTEADLRDAKGIAYFGPMLSSGRIVYANIRGGKIVYYAGCFYGTKEELIARSKEKHTEAEHACYLAGIRFVESVLKPQMEDRDERNDE